MSVTSGGTAPKSFSAGGSSSGSFGTAGMVIAFLASNDPSDLRDQCHTEALRSATETTTPTNPSVRRGSWAGRSSSTIWCSSPRSMTCR